MRTRARPLWPDARSPGSRTRSVHTCWGLRPRRAVQALAMTRLAMLPSAQSTASATRGGCFRVSIPSLCAPLSTLHQHPHGCQRMTRGQCGSLDLHWERLALSTPCRSPGARMVTATIDERSEEHTSELQSPDHLVCRLLLEKKKNQ